MPPGQELVGHSLGILGEAPIHFLSDSREVSSELEIRLSWIH